MKLLTELRQDENGAWYAHDPDPYQASGAVARDAVAAHMLKLATWGIPKRYRDWVEMRASELMAEWGFDSGEVE